MDGIEPPMVLTNEFTAHLSYQMRIIPLGDIIMLVYSSAAGSPTTTIFRLNRNWCHTLKFSHWNQKS